MDDIRALVENFTSHLSSLIEGAVIERARAVVDGALGGSKGAGRRGRPPKTLAFTASGRPRKKAPIQLCPVPGCRNPAAPVFGMVCAKHMDVPKAKIKKYREARRARKLKGKA